MPSIASVLLRDQPHCVRTNQQVAQLSLPPLMKQVNGNDAGTADPVELLPAKEGVSYIIYGVVVGGSNNAGTPATRINLNYFSPETGVEQRVIGIRLTASQVNNNQAIITGLNLMTHPGRAVSLKCDGICETKDATVFYNEVGN